MRLPRVLRRGSDESLYGHLNPAKLDVIDRAFRDLGVRTFADMGGIWAVDGGYSRYAADIHKADRGVLVDDDFTDAYRDAAKRLPNLQEKRGNFGDRELIASLEPFDLAIFFDVLLHQANPDWDELLDLYAPKCRAMAIVQPQWNGSETIRLFDLGEEEYLKAVPSDDDIYVGLFDRLDEINPRRGQPWREVHDVWQWGITDEGLIAKMRELGFEVQHEEITGPWQGLEHFHETAFVFARP